MGMVGLGATLAVLAIAYQRGQTGRCLAFFGPTHARRVTGAERVELVLVLPSGAAGRLRTAERHDVSAAKGLVHLRRGLVEDANFKWPRPGSGAAADGPAGVGPRSRLPDGRWHYALRFSEAASRQGDAWNGLGATPEAAADAGSTTIVFAPAEPGSDPDGWMAVVGAPGRVPLGRIAEGLDTWIRDARGGRGTPKAGDDGPGRGGRPGEQGRSGEFGRNGRPRE